MTQRACLRVYRKPPDLGAASLREFVDALREAIDRQRALAESIPGILRPTADPVEQEDAVVVAHAPAAPAFADALFGGAGSGAPADELFAFTLDAAAALRAAHEHPRSPIHGGVCPAVFLRDAETGALLVADFGVAAAYARASSSAYQALAVRAGTGTEAATVTWECLPDSEESRDDRLGPFVDYLKHHSRNFTTFRRTNDVYALGIVIYLMAHRRHPYLADAEDHRFPGILSELITSAAAQPVARPDLRAATSGAIAEWRRHVDRMCRSTEAERPTLPDLLKDLQPLRVQKRDPAEFTKLLESRLWLLIEADPSAKLGGTRALTAAVSDLVFTSAQQDRLRGRVRITTQEELPGIAPIDAPFEFDCASDRADLVFSAEDRKALSSWFRNYGGAVQQGALASLSATLAPRYAAAQMAVQDALPRATAAAELRLGGDAPPAPVSLRWSDAKRAWEWADARVLVSLLTERLRSTAQAAIQAAVATAAARSDSAATDGSTLGEIESGVAWVAIAGGVDELVKRVALSGTVTLASPRAAPGASPKTVRATVTLEPAGAATVTSGASELAAAVHALRPPPPPPPPPPTPPSATAAPPAGPTAPPAKPEAAPPATVAPKEPKTPPASSKPAPPPSLPSQPANPSAGPTPTREVTPPAPEPSKPAAPPAAGKAATGAAAHDNPGSRAADSRPSEAARGVPPDAGAGAAAPVLKPAESKPAVSKPGDAGSAPKQKGVASGARPDADQAGKPRSGERPPAGANPPPAQKRTAAPAAKPPPTGGIDPPVAKKAEPGTADGRRRRAIMLGGAGGGVLVVSLILFFALRGGGGKGDAPPPPPPPVTGACCFAGADAGGPETCRVLSSADCAGADGRYVGDNTTCTPSPCKVESVTPPPPPPATGACCIAGADAAAAETCRVLSPADCASAGGRYVGDNAACTPSPCKVETVLPPPPPALTGACCVPIADGGGSTCTADLPRADCEARGGFYAGDSSLCAVCPPERPTSTRELSAVIEWCRAATDDQWALAGRVYSPALVEELRMLAKLGDVAARGMDAVTGEPPGSPLSAELPRLPLSIELCGEVYRGFVVSSGAGEVTATSFSIVYVQTDVTAADRAVTPADAVSRVSASCDAAARQLPAVAVLQPRIALPTVGQWQALSRALAPSATADGPLTALARDLLWGAPEWALSAEGPPRLIGGITVDPPAGTGGSPRLVPALRDGELEAWLANPLVRPRAREDGGVVRRVIVVWSGR